MRSPLAILAMLSIAACVGPGTYTVVPQSTPAPVVQRPAVSPMEITIVRPESGRLLVQTNRAAYLALFEIVPDRGVALIYPTNARQQSMRMAGLSWLPIGWTMAPASYDRGRYGERVRHVFALASDRPFRISEEAYDDAYMRRVLGSAAYRASDPEYTMRALARHFLRVMPTEEWSQDLYTLETLSSRPPYRLVRVSCPDGSIYEVREEVALRMRCTNRGPVNPTIPPRIADVPVRTPPQNPPAQGDTARNPRIPIFGGTLRGPQRDTSRLGRGDTANDGDGRSEPQQQGNTKPRTEPDRPNPPAWGRPDVPGAKGDQKRDERDAKKDEHDARKEEQRDAREERKADQRDARDERKADQREAKEERKEEQREVKDERKEDKREVKEEKHEEKAEQREVKQEQQQEKKVDQREAKEEKKDEKAEDKQEKADDKGKKKGPSWSKPRPPSSL